jgi:signal transduction histidine kinase
MANLRNKYESEVHLGLLMIVFLLIFISLISNYVMYRARTSLREQTIGKIQTSAVAITRGVQQNYPAELNETDKQQYLLKYGLSGVQLVTSTPPDESIESRRRWLAQIVRNLPPDQLPTLIPSLLGTEFRRLTRGKGSEYFFVQPLPPGSGQHVLILSVNVPDLAFLDDSARTVFWTGVGALGFVALLYLVLSRSIFKPFRRIREQARLSGRTLTHERDDADLVVEEYRRIIAELRDKEAELVRLNDSITNRADSLEQFNQYLLASIESGIITLDNEARVKSINAAAARFLGLAEPPDSQASLKQLFGSIREIPILIEHALRSGKALPYQEIRHNDGEHIRTFGVAVSFVRDSRELPVGVSILLNDLTEVSELRSQLEKKNRLEALGEMSGGLAHQLRNSMGAINGYAILAKRRLGKEENVQAGEAIERLLQESKESENLIGKFLSFARPFDFNPQLISLSPLIEEVLTGFRNREDCRHITFRFEPLVDSPARADALLLKQSLTNLIENAVLAYEGLAGPVTVSLSRDSENWTMAVTDQAGGIPQDKLDKIFTPFYSSRPSGTGLGLPLAARIVDLHGGRITVSSVAGRGTTFRIQMPVCQASPA